MLPDHDPTAKWEPAPASWMPIQHGGRFPVTRLPDGRLAIDQCRRTDGGYDVRVFDNQPHRNARLIPDDAPGVVRMLFSARGQLRLLRTTDYLERERLIKAARKAWNKYRPAQWLAGWTVEDEAA